MRLVVALRTARAAVGWSQDELGRHLDIPKTTIARAELLEGGLRADQLAQIIRFYKSTGVEVDFMVNDDVIIKVSNNGLKIAMSRLLEHTNRRTDRKKDGVSRIAKAEEKRKLTDKECSEGEGSK